MANASVIERAKRIARIRRVRKDWNSTGFPALWRNHTTASHEFQLLDVLRDIRLVLTFIMLLLALEHLQQAACRPATRRYCRGVQ